jgi:hypothetical protein
MSNRPDLADLKVSAAIEQVLEGAFIETGSLHGTEDQQRMELVIAGLELVDKDSRIDVMAGAISALALIDLGLAFGYADDLSHQLYLIEEGQI